MGIDLNFTPVHGIGGVSPEIEDDTEELVPVGRNCEIRFYVVPPHQGAAAGGGKGGADIAHQWRQLEPPGLDFGFPGTAEIQGLLTKRDGMVDGL